MEIDQSEFDNILDNEIRPYVSNLISNSPFHSNKNKYVEECWLNLFDFLTKLNLPEDTFRTLNVRYRKKIEKEILNLK